MLPLPISAGAQTSAGIPPSISTPNKVESRAGPLFFKDGMPSKETTAKVYDNLDFTHAFEAFVNTLQGVSIHALRKGLQSAGVKDNEVIVFSELMDAKSLFLTANADTVYGVRRPRSHQGTRRARGAAPISRRLRRRVVPMGYRHRPARSRPRRRREVPGRAPGL
jgi:hypothetical protein